MNASDGRLARLAAKQHRLVHREQALHCGLTSRQIHGRVALGVLDRIQRNVYLMGGGKPSFQQSVLAACLSAGDGAAASHPSAAGLWLLRGIEHPPTEITVVGTRQPELRGVGGAPHHELETD